MQLVMRHAGGSVDDEAREWGLAPRTARLLFVLPFLGGALLGVVDIFSRPVVAFVLEEDHLAEWGTSLALLAAAVLAGVVARRLWRRGERVQALAYVLLAIGTFLGAGEEISWGQRVIGLETPESVMAANLQEELNVHNLGVVYPLYVAALLLVGLYGSLGSWLVYRRSERPHPNWRLFMPPLFLAGAFLQLALYRLGRYAGMPGYRYGEWTELCAAAAIAFFVALNVRRLASEGRARRPVP